MRIRKRGAAALLAAVAIALTGCAGPAASPSPSSTAGGTVNVVASTNVWGDIATSIGGDAVKVTSIISDPNQDPHDYQADTRNQLALAQAHLVIENGGGYDDFMDTMMKASGNTTAPVLNAVTISGLTATAGQELNEHVWYSYATVKSVAEAIRDALSKIDPGNASTFSSNTETFEQGLAKLDASVATLKSSYAGKGVAITEPVPLYLTNAIGLVNKTPKEFSEAIENDTDVSALVLQKTLALFSGHQVSLLAYNEQTTGPQTQKVLSAAQSAAIPVVPVQETLPTGKHYLDWQAGIIAAIGSALAK